MSEYDEIPSTPMQNAEKAFMNAIDQAEKVPTPERGVIMEDPKKEQFAQDLLMDNNPLGAVAKYATSTAKEAACTPAQIANIEEERRLSGIPVVQGLVMAVEKSASAITGNDVQFDGAMKAARIVDNIGKPLATGGASLAADSLYEASLNVKDAATCMTMDKDIELPYYGEDHYAPGEYPYDVQVSAQPTKPFIPIDMNSSELSEADLAEINAMYNPDNVMTPSGLPNPNSSMPKAGDIVDSSPVSRTPLNVPVSQRPEYSYGPSI